MRDGILCLVGASGTGKTSIAKRLEERGFNVIHSYTTRPARHPDEWGHTFVKDYPHEHVPQTIAYNVYNGYEYWATTDQYKGKGVSIYIIDPTGVEQLLNAWVAKMQDVLHLEVAYLYADERERLKRLVMQRSTTEAMDRIEYDRKAFRLSPATLCLDTTHIDSEEALEVVYEFARAFKNKLIAEVDCDV